MYYARRSCYQLRANAFISGGRPLHTYDTATELVDLSTIEIDADALRRVPRNLALRHDVLSLSSDGNQLTIAVADASDRETIDRVRFATGMHVRAVTARRQDIRDRLGRVYDPGVRNAYDAPAVRAVDEMHRHAAARHASDVHVEPYAAGGRIRERVDGLLSETRELNAELYAQIVSRIKLLAGMDIADRRQPQDGRYAIELESQSFDARVSSMPTIGGEKLVIRLFASHARVPALADLGMPADCLAQFRRFIQGPHGFIVVCGPTGSGKTTTLYAACGERDRLVQNICSVEDPVEIRIPGVTQVQVHPRAGVTFSSALRALLRQDPDAIMIGEMRDAETAAIAASAALSGRLVLTTLHAGDACSAIERLSELGVPRQTLAAGLTAVIGQRLARRRCTHCRDGCLLCDSTGYAGRIALFELLVVDDAIRDAIASGWSGAQLASLAQSRGFAPLAAQAAARIASGETTRDDVSRILRFEERY